MAELLSTLLDKWSGQPELVSVSQDAMDIIENDELKWQTSALGAIAPNYFSVESRSHREQRGQEHIQKLLQK